MAPHEVPMLYTCSTRCRPFVFAGVYIVACSLIREPARRNFNAIMMGGGWTRLSESRLRCV